MAPTTRPWNRTEPKRFPARWSSPRSLRVSLTGVAMAVSPLVLDRSRDDADVGDAGELDRVHDGGEGAEGHALVRADVDDAVRAGDAALELSRQLIDVDRLVLQEDVLVLVDGDDHVLLGELADGT